VKAVGCLSTNWRRCRQIPGCGPRRGCCLWHDIWRELSGGEGAQELKNFTPLGKGLAPATQFDVLIHILSLRHDVNFSVAQAALAAFGDTLDVKEETHGFRWVEDRDLSGFVDGTENPAGDEIRRDVAVIKDGWMLAAAMCWYSAGNTTSNSLIA
jgi:deferrochelatase/peroxidase EfeB